MHAKKKPRRYVEPGQLQQVPYTQRSKDRSPRGGPRLWGSVYVALALEWTEYSRLLATLAGMVASACLLFLFFWALVEAAELARVVKVQDGHLCLAQLASLRFTPLPFTSLAVRMTTLTCTSTRTWSRAATTAGALLPPVVYRSSPDISRRPFTTTIRAAPSVQPLPSAETSPSPPTAHHRCRQLGRPRHSGPTLHPLLSHGMIQSLLPPT